jgi:hypothetical protein
VATPIVLSCRHVRESFQLQVSSAGVEAMPTSSDSIPAFQGCYSCSGFSIWFGGALQTPPDAAKRLPLTSNCHQRCINMSIWSGQDGSAGENPGNRLRWVAW